MPAELYLSVGWNPAINLPADVKLVQSFLFAYLTKFNESLRNTAMAWRDGVVDESLCKAIEYFQKKQLLPARDGIVQRGGATWKEMQKLAPGLSIPQWVERAKSNFMDLKVIRIRQALPTTMYPGQSSIIDPTSIHPYIFPPIPKKASFNEIGVYGDFHHLLFEIQKNNTTFWVGAGVPYRTDNFNRAYIYFHPDTLGAAEDKSYAGFTGRWLEVERYVGGRGVQMASVMAMTVLVPFMTPASKNNSATTNLFADRGLDTLNDIMLAIMLTLGVVDKSPSLQEIGISSFSSGITHLAGFVRNLKATGIIREQIDFDSAYMTNPPARLTVMSGTSNWMVTQASPPAKPTGNRWLYLPSSGFQNLPKGLTPKQWNDLVHGKIGRMMFGPMMRHSVFR